MGFQDVRYFNSVGRVSRRRVGDWYDGHHFTPFDHLPRGNNRAWSRF
jgi:hypothetical protein